MQLFQFLTLRIIPSLGRNATGASQHFMRVVVMAWRHRLPDSVFGIHSPKRLGFFEAGRFRPEPLPRERSAIRHGHEGKVGWGLKPIAAATRAITG